ITSLLFYFGGCWLAGRAKYGYLLNDVDVRRWYENVARGSRVTADVYLRRLGSFCERFNVSPKQLIAMGEGDLYNMLLDYVSFLEGNGCAGSYIESALKAVKSWLAHNGIEVKRKIKIRGARDTPSLRDERVPTQQRQILTSTARRIPFHVRGQHRYCSGPTPWYPQPDNGVYDMDTYPRTISGKIVFAFIGTCLSANLTNPITGEPWKGLVVGRARGLPFAFTKRFVLPRTNPRFDVRYHISADGYSQPDSGPQCYIGFTFGSASLMQRIPYNTGIEYVHWVYYFFYYALSYEMSVNHALDHASWQCWGQYFGTCPLRVGFIAVWWFWSPTSGWYTWSGSGKMAVYGNGNIYLRQ
ncbi:MAG: hypothetical protein QXX41_11825, partial [Nitrososphaerota archaeon]